MSPLAWILVSGVAMNAIALVGALVLLLPAEVLRRLLRPLVAFAAGSLLGGAFFHMIPAAAERTSNPSWLYGLVLSGFSVFLALEQLLHWHHCHRDAVQCQKPVATLILVGDALHNLLGGMSIGGIFLVDARLGVLAWIAAAAHEVPQELGDFAVLLHGGWRPGRALAFNVASGSTFLLGGLLVYLVGGALDVTPLIPFAAGNFIYIGASDLVPEIKEHDRRREGLLHLMTFVAGLALMLLVRLVGVH